MALVMTSVTVRVVPEMEEKYKIALDFRNVAAWR